MDECLMYKQCYLKGNEERLNTKMLQNSIEDEESVEKWQWQMENKET